MITQINNPTLTPTISTNSKYLMVGCSILIILGLGVGLGVGLSPSSNTALNENWWGCSGYHEKTPNPLFLFQLTGTIYGPSNNINVHFAGINTMTQQTFKSLSGSMAGGLDGFFAALHNIGNDLNACETSNNQYIHFLCNSTRTENLCANLIANYFALVSFAPLELYILFDPTIPNNIIVHNNTNITLGYCGVAEPLIFSDITNHVLGGGSLAQIINGLFNLSLCE